MSCIAQTFLPRLLMLYRYLYKILPDVSIAFVSVIEAAPEPGRLRPGWRRLHWPFRPGSCGSVIGGRKSSCFHAVFAWRRELGSQRTRGCSSAGDLSASRFAKSLSWRWMASSSSRWSPGRWKRSRWRSRPRARRACPPAPPARRPLPPLRTLSLGGCGRLPPGAAARGAARARGRGRAGVMSR